MAARMSEIPLGKNHELLVCASHKLELCHRCCYDFTEANNVSRELYAMEKAAKKPMKKGLLPKGTCVRMKDRSGRNNDLLATVIAFQMGDPHGFGDHLPCYVLKNKNGNNDQFLVFVDEVHEEYLLEDVTFDQIKQIVLAGQKARGKSEEVPDEEGED